MTTDENNEIAEKHHRVSIFTSGEHAVSSIGSKFSLRFKSRNMAFQPVRVCQEVSEGKLLFPNVNCVK